MVDYQTISFYIGVFSVVFGVITWYIQSRRNQKITQASLYMQLHAQWRDRKFIDNYYSMLQWEWKDLDDYAENILSDHEKSLTTTEIIWYFESVGQLLREGLIEPDIVYTMLGDRFMNWAEKYADILKAVRDLYEAPERYRNIEYLYEEMKKRQQTVRKQYQK